MIISNIVGKEKMRQVQSETLSIITTALKGSFGPWGTNTTIVKEFSGNEVVTKYTKDGHTILGSVAFMDVIERAIQNDLVDLTRYIVKKVGDGTTSAVILSCIIFEGLKKIEEDFNLTPYQIIRDFKAAVELIKEDIMKSAQPFDAEMAYNIALISTNGNEEVADNIKHIYEQFGNDVFVDVSISTTEEHLLKEYDGMTLETGYSDTAYINNAKKGIASLRNPAIYCFEDPVDTVEMMSYLQSIIYNNIMKAYAPDADPDEAKIIPTVIMAPMISRDMSAYIEQVINFLYQFKDENQKPPLLMISNIYNKEQYIDIARMCGAKFIKKYIDPRQQAEDVARGLAPTLETVNTFAGSADIVESDVSKTKFVNPMNMHDADGNTSTDFNNLVGFLQAELQKAYEEGEDANVTGGLKRRINALKANMVEYLVGGVAVTDRDSVRDLVEDAVLNCRSAAKNGVGFGANFEGLRSARALTATHKDNSMLQMITGAYNILAKELYATCHNEIEAAKIVETSLEKGCPYNLKTESYDGKVLCTIDTDIVILETISKIISLMFTSNQFLCPTPTHNKYETVK